MNTGPLTEKELEWLDDILLKYRNEDSVCDTSELDGYLTAILSGPNDMEASYWLTAMWGGEKQIPRWSSEREMTRFMNLTFQHMNDINERLCEAPDQFEPLFGINDINGEAFTVVEDWCYGYMRGVTLGEWPEPVPEELADDFNNIALHGKDENQAEMENMTEEAFFNSQEAIGPGALRMHHYWMQKCAELPPEQVVRGEPKVGRNDPCPCGSGKKFKQCCLSKG